MKASNYLNQISKLTNVSTGQRLHARGPEEDQVVGAEQRRLRDLPQAPLRSRVQGQARLVGGGEREDHHGQQAGLRDGQHRAGTGPEGGKRRVSQDEAALRSGGVSSQAGIFQSWKTSLVDF